MRFNDLKTDKQLDSKGVWIEYPDHTEDAEAAEFLIASTSSLEYRKALNKEVRNRFHRKWMEDVEARDEAEIQAMAKAILLGWRGAVYMDGSKQPTPFSQEMALAALRIPAFKAWVEAEANNLSNFQAQEKAADVAALKSSP